MEKEVKGDMERQGVEYYCEIYSGRKFIGFTIEAFKDSLRLTYATHHWNQILDHQNNQEGLEGGIKFPISWYMYLFYMECFFMKEGCKSGKMFHRNP